MSVFAKLAPLAVREIAKALGGETAGKVVDRVCAHLTTHNEQLLLAVRRSIDKAWRAVEIALEGEGVLSRLDKADDQDFRLRLTRFLDGAGVSIDAALRSQARAEL